MIEAIEILNQILAGLHVGEEEGFSELRALIIDVGMHNTSPRVRNGTVRLAIDLSAMSPEYHREIFEIAREAIGSVSSSDSCREIFSLMQELIGKEEDPERLDSVAKVMVEKLTSFSRIKDGRPGDALLAGCIELLTSVFSNAERVQGYGEDLVELLWNDFLFAVPTQEKKENWPICKTVETRKLAFQLLKALAKTGENTACVMRLISSFDNFDGVSSAYPSKAKTIDLVGLKTKAARAT